MNDGAERGTVREAAKILGLNVRKIQTMSQRGKIPSAAKIGRQWTYDLVRLRTFVGEQERATTCQRNENPRRGATGVVKCFGAALRSVDIASGGRLGQMIQQSQRRVGKRAGVVCCGTVNIAKVSSGTAPL